MAVAGRLETHHWRLITAGLWGIALGRCAERVRSATRAAAFVRPAGQEDVQQLSAAMGAPATFVAGRLARGNRCYIAEKAGTVAAYGWLSTGREQVPELDRVVHPGRKEAYIWDCLTLPAYRGRGLMPAILRQLSADLACQGLRHAWAVILADNVASQRAFARASFILVLNITYRRQPGLSDLALVGDPAAPRALVAAATRLFER